MSTIPHDSGLDHSAAFRADPYRFISRRCRELGTDVFETRLLLHRTLCVSGAEAAIELMKAAVSFLAKELHYRVPPQDLRIDFAHLSALPVSRFVIADVRS